MFLRALHVTACRRLSTTAPSTSMSAWQLHAYNDDLVLDEVPMPRIDRPDDMIVQIHAASVNPIDTRMRAGYGDTLVGALRQLGQRSVLPVSPFPLILGRDCSGVVQEVGANVRQFKVGDEVYCAVGAQRPGTHAEYVLVDATSAAPKPTNVSHGEAASLAYVGATTHAALIHFGHLKPANCRRMRFLVHGASGGIGSFACQLLKAWGASHVVGTCSEDACELVSSLGVTPVAYEDEQAAFERLIDVGPFDMVLDTVNSTLSQRSMDLLGIWRHSTFVSLVSPLMHDTDKYGAVLGAVKSAFSYGLTAFQPLTKGRWFTYAYFIPSGKALDEIGNFVKQGKIKPIIDKVFDFSSVPAAYDKVAQLHGRGKTVIKMK